MVSDEYHKTHESLVWDSIGYTSKQFNAEIGIGRCIKYKGF